MAVLKSHLSDYTQSFNEASLENLLSNDPSNYSVVLALALEMKRTGRLERSKQLLNRVANSGYPERKLAQQTLLTLHT